MTSSKDYWEPNSKSEFKRRTIEGIITSAPIMEFYTIGINQKSHTSIQVNKKDYKLPGAHYLQKGQKIKLTLIINPENLSAPGEDKIEKYSILNDKSKDIFKFSYGY